MSTVVLDASAVIALLRGEPGADRVRQTLEQSDTSAPGVALLSTVNLTEILQLLGPDLPDIIGTEQSIITVTDFTTVQAQAAAAMHQATRVAGLGLGDRACLALAKVHGLPVLTGDRAWATLDLDIDVELIR